MRDPTPVPPVPPPPSDEDRARLEAAVKRDDGFFTTYCVSSWSPHLVRLAAELRLTPNAVTGVSVGLAALAAVWFSEGTREARIAGAVLLYLSFVLDCVDGQLARYTGAFSACGSWLDATFDRVKEYTVYAGLAAGYGVAPGGGSDAAQDVWRLAVAALVLQVLRHTLDSAYAAARPPAPADGAEAAPAGGVAVLSRRLERGAVARRLKRMIVLPIGERTALIAVTAAVFDARVTFLALLAWGGLATLYMLGGRMGRSMAR
ncbi:CDP-alcohol phosphatidyltransferase family protein [Planomonospora corallina]|uniref:CDP-alcohol phosphatidyltransferase family protein n=1 Tax=Planomonospora corallina TaxID=1806052 RepID=A0ABV8I496_9ACTN